MWLRFVNQPPEEAAVKNELHTYPATFELFASGRNNQSTLGQRRCFLRTTVEFATTSSSIAFSARTCNAESLVTSMRWLHKASQVGSATVQAAGTVMHHFQKTWRWTLKTSCLKIKRCLPHSFLRFNKHENWKEVTKLCGGSSTPRQRAEGQQYEKPHLYIYHNSWINCNARTR